MCFISGCNSAFCLNQVRHSQSISLPQLRPWVILRAAGEVETAHCTCMAGLGEACSHIATTLFALESIVKTVVERACTSEPCSWLSVSSNIRHPYVEGAMLSYFSRHVVIGMTY